MRVNFRFVHACNHKMDNSNWDDFCEGDNVECMGTVSYRKSTWNLLTCVMYNNLEKVF